ncbi:MAG: STAS/SEC14 domain-containing protein [Salinimicrobium sp.]
MNNKVELDFGVVWIDDKILVSELHEGVLLDVENNRKILALGREIFEGEAFGYISHRINSYAVDPMVYRESAENEQLRAIAVVSDKEMARKSAQLEKKFYTNKNSFQIFGSLEEAKTWIREVIACQSKIDSFS